MAYVDKFRNRNRFVFANNDELYEDCVRMSDLDEFLGDLWGFKRVETKLVGNQKWGDALYVKQS